MKIQTIIEEAAAAFNVDPIDIVAQYGKVGRDISTARYVCAFLLREYLAKDKIAALLGRRNSQYAYAAIKRVQTRSQEDRYFQKKVLKLSDRFCVQWN